MTAKNAPQTAETNIDAKDAKVPHQAPTKETKVAVEMTEDGVTLITVSDEPQSVISKLKNLLKNRKVLAGASAALTIAALVVVKKNVSKPAVEDESGEDNPTT